MTKLKDWIVYLWEFYAIAIERNPDWVAVLWPASIALIVWRMWG